MYRLIDDECISALWIVDTAKYEFNIVFDQISVPDLVSKPSDP
jgi:hypothetical protein